MKAAILIFAFALLLAFSHTALAQDAGLTKEATSLHLRPQAMQVQAIRQHAQVMAPQFLNFHLYEPFRSNQITAPPYLKVFPKPVYQFNSKYIGETTVYLGYWPNGSFQYMQCITSATSAMQAQVFCRNPATSPNGTKTVTVVYKKMKTGISKLSH